MTDTERLDKLERILTSHKSFANGIGFVPYSSIQTNLDVFSVLRLSEEASVFGDEMLSSQPTLRAAIDAL